MTRKKQFPSPLRIHLGCGKRFFPGFIHIDQDSYPHIDYQRDIKDLSIFPNNSADYIYACHCFNSFDDHEARAGLTEWFRVLKKGGMLHLAVPDFAAIAKAYTRWKNLQLVERLVTGYYETKTKVIQYHKAVYNEETLRILFSSIGFRKIKRYNWKKTQHAQYDDYSQAYLPHMDKKHGLLMSLNLEAIKP